LIRHRLPVRVAVLCSVAVLSASAWADRLPSNVKSSQNPASVNTQIQSLIDAQVKILAGDDPATAQLARTTLVYEVENHTGSKQSPQYQTAYCADLAKAVIPILAGGKASLRTRVNIGVVVNDVAARTFRNGGDTSPLDPVVQQLLKDKQQAVVLWGLKCSKYILASTLQNAGNATALSKQIAKTAEANSDFGPAIEEAYNALMLQGKELENLKANPAVFGPLVAPIIPDLLDLVESRTAKFKASGGQVPSPQAEHGLGTFLSVNVYDGALAANPKLRDRSLRAMGDLTCAYLRSAANGNVTPESIDMIKEQGKAFQVLGENMQNAGVASVGKAISGIPTNNPNLNALGDLCDSLSNSLKSVNVNINSGGGAAETPAPPALAGTPK